MAIFSSNTSIITRSEGHSAIAASAYRAGEKLRDERTGELHNYAKRQDVAHAEILLPDNAPERLRDRATLWNENERTEKRKDSQLARQQRIALPRELTQAQNIELARAYAKGFVDMGMIADLCIHDKGDGNPHAHILFSMRNLDGEQFRKKNRDWNKDELVEQSRERLAQLINRTLERYGYPDRVDHRSYQEQGITKQPTIHLGSYAHQLEKNGYYSVRGETNNRIREDNAERERLRAERQQTERELVREQSRLAQEADQRRQRIEATQRQQERQAGKEQARQEREARERQYRKPTLAEPLRRVALRDAEWRLRNQEKLYLDNPTLQERADREERQQQARQKSNQRKLYGDRIPPPLRRTAREPRHYRPSEPTERDKLKKRDREEEKPQQTHHERSFTEYERLIKEATERVQRRQERERERERERDPDRDRDR